VRRAGADRLRFEPLDECFRVERLDDDGRAELEAAEPRERPGDLLHVDGRGVVRFRRVCQRRIDDRFRRLRFRGRGGAGRQGEREHEERLKSAATQAAFGIRSHFPKHRPPPGVVA
jgi:hypothetical protein